MMESDSLQDNDVQPQDLPSQPGAGQDLVSTFFTPRAISVAQVWCRVMAYIQCYGPGERLCGSTTPGTPSAMTREFSDRRNGGWADRKVQTGSHCAHQALVYIGSYP